MRRVWLVILLVLLFNPALADGWFADPRLEMKIRYGDPQELRGLLGTLVPDVKYEVHGKIIVAFGSSAALDQVQEMLKELDRPLDQILVDVDIIEILKEDTNEFTLGRPEKPSEMTQTGPGVTTPTYLWPSLRTHVHSRLGFLANHGDIKVLMTKRLEEMPGSRGELKIPKEVGLALFGEKSTTLGINLGQINGHKVDTEFTVRASRRRWISHGWLYDGDPIIMATKRSPKYVILLTPYLMRQ